MNKNVVYLVLTVLVASLISACPHRPRHRNIPKPPHIPKPRIPHLTDYSSHQAVDQSLVLLKLGRKQHNL